MYGLRGDIVQKKGHPREQIHDQRITTDSGHIFELTETPVCQPVISFQILMTRTRWDRKSLRLPSSTKFQIPEVTIL